MLNLEDPEEKMKTGTSCLYSTSSIKNVIRLAFGALLINILRYVLGSSKRDGNFVQSRFDGKDLLR